MPIPSDVELLEGWRVGDMKAGQRLFQRYYGPIERFFINKVSIGVGDLVQETFLACVKGRDKLRESSKFRAYLFAIANKVLDTYLRKRYTHGTELDLMEQSVQDVAAGPFTLMDEYQEEGLLLQALRHIPVDCQVALELHYWENMATAEIAEVLGIPEGTVKSRMRRGRELLNKALARFAASPELLQSTMSNLDDWADKTRRLLNDPPAAQEEPADNAPAAQEESAEDSPAAQEPAENAPAAQEPADDSPGRGGDT